jgi:4-amino-4-deoxy-L-arabinose transferase-like glycosyltransferase
MIPSPRKVGDSTSQPVRHGAIAAKADGFLALLLIALFLGFIYSLTGPRRVTGDFLFESVALLLLYAGSWLFAIGGTRHGAGAGRVAAFAALALLVASAVLVLAVFIRSL